ncbi:MAG: PAS domain S-box protein [Candidatus Omnitrophica bacterium]|nr:PAS domain S-box protein [Candidatus Omnitrophota bacterium]
MIIQLLNRSRENVLAYLSSQFQQTTFNLNDLLEEILMFINDYWLEKTMTVNHVYGHNGKCKGSSDTSSAVKGNDAQKRVPKSLYKDLELYILEAIKILDSLGLVVTNLSIVEQVKKDHPELYTLNVETISRYRRRLNAIDEAISTNQVRMLVKIIREVKREHIFPTAFEIMNRSGLDIGTVIKYRNKHPRVSGVFLRVEEAVIVWAAIELRRKGKAVTGRNIAELLQTTEQTVSLHKVRIVRINQVMDKYVLSTLERVSQGVKNMPKGIPATFINIAGVVRISPRTIARRMKRDARLESVVNSVRRAAMNDIDKKLEEDISDLFFELQDVKGRLLMLKYGRRISRNELKRDISALLVEAEGLAKNSNLPDKLRPRLQVLLNAIEALSDEINQRSIRRMHGYSAGDDPFDPDCLFDAVSSPIKWQNKKQKEISDFLWRSLSHIGYSQDELTFYLPLLTVEFTRLLKEADLDNVICRFKRKYSGNDYVREIAEYLVINSWLIAGKTSKGEGLLTKFLVNALNGADIYEEMSSLGLNKQLRLDFENRLYKDSLTQLAYLLLSYVLDDDLLKEYKILGANTHKNSFILILMPKDMALLVDFYNLNVMELYFRLDGLSPSLFILKNNAFELREEFKLSREELNKIYNVSFGHLGVKTLKGILNLHYPEINIYEQYALTPFLLVSLGDISCYCGNYLKAEVSYFLAIKLRPDYSLAYSNLGNIMAAQGRFTDAESYLKRAIEIGQDFMSSQVYLGILYLNLGKVYLIQNKFDKAVECLEKSLDSQFDLGETTYCLSLCCVQTGDRDKATKFLAQAIFYNLKYYFSWPLEYVDILDQAMKMSVGYSGGCNGRLVFADKKSSSAIQNLTETEFDRYILQKGKIFLSMLEDYYRQRFSADLKPSSIYLKEKLSGLWPRRTNAGVHYISPEGAFVLVAKAIQATGKEGSDISLLDLGSGNGVFDLGLASILGLSVEGWELDGSLYKESLSIREYGLRRGLITADQLSFVRGDYLKASLLTQQKRHRIIYYFGMGTFREGEEILQERILRMLKPGQFFVSFGQTLNPFDKLKQGLPWLYYRAELGGYIFGVVSSPINEPVFLVEAKWCMHMRPFILLCELVRYIEDELGIKVYLTIKDNNCNILYAQTDCSLGQLDHNDASAKEAQVIITALLPCCEYHHDIIIIREKHYYLFTIKQADAITEQQLEKIRWWFEQLMQNKFKRRNNTVIDVTFPRDLPFEKTISIEDKNELFKLAGINFRIKEPVIVQPVVIGSNDPLLLAMWEEYCPPKPDDDSAGSPVKEPFNSSSSSRNSGKDRKKRFSPAYHKRIQDIKEIVAELTRELNRAPNLWEVAQGLPGLRGPPHTKASSLGKWFSYHGLSYNDFGIVLFSGFSSDTILNSLSFAGLRLEIPKELRGILTSRANILPYSQASRVELFDPKHPKIKLVINKADNCLTLKFSIGKERFEDNLKISANQTEVKIDTYVTFIAFRDRVLGISGKFSSARKFALLKLVKQLGQKSKNHNQRNINFNNSVLTLPSFYRGKNSSGAKIILYRDAQTYSRFLVVMDLNNEKNFIVFEVRGKQIVSSLTGEALIPSGVMYDKRRKTTMPLFMLNKLREFVEFDNNLNKSAEVNLRPSEKLSVVSLLRTRFVFTHTQIIKAYLFCRGRSRAKSVRDDFARYPIRLMVGKKEIVISVFDRKENIFTVSGLNFGDKPLLLKGDYFNLSLIAELLRKDCFPEIVNADQIFLNTFSCICVDEKYLLKRKMRSYVLDTGKGMLISSKSNSTIPRSELLTKGLVITGTSFSSDCILKSSSPVTNSEILLAAFYAALLVRPMLKLFDYLCLKLFYWQVGFTISERIAYIDSAEIDKIELLKTMLNLPHENKMVKLAVIDRLEFFVKNGNLNNIKVFQMQELVDELRELKLAEDEFARANNLPIYPYYLNRLEELCVVIEERLLANKASSSSVGSEKSEFSETGIALNDAARKEALLKYQLAINTFYTRVVKLEKVEVERVIGSFARLKSIRIGLPRIGIQTRQKGGFTTFDKTVPSDIDIVVNIKTGDDQEYDDFMDKLIEIVSAISEECSVLIHLHEMREYVSFWGPDNEELRRIEAAERDVEAEDLSATIKINDLLGRGLIRLFYQTVSQFKTSDEAVNLSAYPAVTAKDGYPISAVLRIIGENIFSFFEKMPIGVHIIDPQGRILYVNSGELNRLGYSSEEMIGNKIFDFIDEEQREDAWVRFQAKLRGEVLPKSPYRLYVRKDGTMISGLTEDRIIRDENGQVVAVITTFEDITEIYNPQDGSDEASLNDVSQDIGFVQVFDEEIESLFMLLREVKFKQPELLIVKSGLVSQAYNLWCQLKELSSEHGYDEYLRFSERLVVISEFLARLHTQDHLHEQAKEEVIEKCIALNKKIRDFCKNNPAKNSASSSIGTGSECLENIKRAILKHRNAMQNWRGRFNRPNSYTLFSWAGLDEILILKYLFSLGLLKEKVFVPCCGLDLFASLFTRIFAVDEDYHSKITFLSFIEDKDQEELFNKYVDLRIAAGNLKFFEKDELKNNIFDSEFILTLARSENFKTLILKDVSAFVKYSPKQASYRDWKFEWVSAISKTDIEIVLLFNADVMLEPMFTKNGFTKSSRAHDLETLINWHPYVLAAPLVGRKSFEPVHKLVVLTKAVSSALGPVSLLNIIDVASSALDGLSTHEFVVGKFSKFGIALNQQAYRESLQAYQGVINLFINEINRIHNVHIVCVLGSFARLVVVPSVAWPRVGNYKNHHRFVDIKSGEIFKIVGKDAPSDFDVVVGAKGVPCSEDFKIMQEIVLFRNRIFVDHGVLIDVWQKYEFDGFLMNRSNSDFLKERAQARGLTMDEMLVFAGIRCFEGDGLLRIFENRKPFVNSSSSSLESNFMKLMKLSGNIARKIKKMYDDRSLFDVIAELGELMNVESDRRMGHIHGNVAEHSVATLELLEKLPGVIMPDKLLSERENLVRRDVRRKIAEVYKQVRFSEDFYLLRLAALLHDIGKVRRFKRNTDPGHDEYGAFEIIPVILNRLGLGELSQETIKYLVSNVDVQAFFMNNRDIDSPSAILELVSILGNDLHKIRMLYLLALSDFVAVDPVKNTGNLWQLLQMIGLFSRIVSFVSDKEYQRLAKEEVEIKLSGLRNDYGEQLVDLYLDLVGVVHLIGNSLRKIRDELDLIKGINENQAAVRIFKRQRDYDFEMYDELLVVSAKDKPGILMAITAILIKSGYDIHRAKIRTVANGLVFNRFLVKFGGEDVSHIEPSCLESAITSILSQFMENEAAAISILNLLLHGYSFEKNNVNCLHQTEVRFVDDNNKTIMEVYAADRRGLIFLISTCIFSLGINIIDAPVDTKGFYAKDAFILEKDKDKLSEDLKNILSVILKEVLDLETIGCAQVFAHAKQRLREFSSSAIKNKEFCSLSELGYLNREKRLILKLKLTFNHERPGILHDIFFAVFEALGPEAGIIVQLIRNDQQREILLDILIKPACISSVEMLKDSLSLIEDYLDEEYAKRLKQIWTIEFSAKYSIMKFVDITGFFKANNVNIVSFLNPQPKEGGYLRYLFGIEIPVDVELKSLKDVLAKELQVGKKSIRFYPGRLSNNLVKRLLRGIDIKFTQNQRELLNKAVQIVAKKQMGVLRKDHFTPAIIHVFDAAIVALREIKIQKYLTKKQVWMVLMVILLHDSLEDGDVDEQSLKEIFG